MNDRTSIKSGSDALALAGAGLAIAAGFAIAIHATVGIVRFVLFLAVG